MNGGTTRREFLQISAKYGFTSAFLALNPDILSSQELESKMSEIALKREKKKPLKP